MPTQQKQQKAGCVTIGAVSLGLISFASGGLVWLATQDNPIAPCFMLPGLIFGLLLGLIGLIISMGTGRWTASAVALAGVIICGMMLFRAVQVTFFAVKTTAHVATFVGQALVKTTTQSIDELIKTAMRPITRPASQPASQDDGEDLSERDTLAPLIVIEP